MSRLTCFVYLTDENGEVHGFGPNSTVPDWARAQITNPNVWEKAPVESNPVASGGSGSDGGQVVVETVRAGDGPPPQGGPGASRQKWADYATPLLREKGVTVEESWKREDIIAACEKAGVPV